MNSTTVEDMKTTNIENRSLELKQRRRELHVFLLATAEPKGVEAAFVLRHKARALRKIGEFIVGPFGSARREEAARFAEVSHLFVAPARVDEIR